MKKIIKKIKSEKFTYKIGYDEINGKIYPKVEMICNDKSLSRNNWADVSYGGELFDLEISTSETVCYGSTSTVEETFTKLREYDDVPFEVESSFKTIFDFYKLNDFNKI